MFDVVFGKARELSERRRPFAIAIVVRREAPVSGRPGDKAIIEADGAVHGWIGGGCTQPVIVREARDAIRDGQVRLVRITPVSSAAPQAGVTEYAMECHGGGALDIYIEPIMPTTQLLILGHSVVARTLARLGKVLNYRVVAVAPPASEALFPEADLVLTALDSNRVDLTGSYVVVSTQGDWDREALEAVTALNVPYAAFVASRRKAGEVFRDLQESGTAPEALGRIKVPAGLDIQARTPEEIAVSILAEIIQVMRSRGPVESPEASPPRDSVEAVLNLANMSCAHCVATVESTLNAIDGVTVREVTVGSAGIRYAPETVSREQILDRLELAGYPVVD